MILFRLAFIYLTAIHIFLGTSSAETVIDRVEELQKHGDTYYWLSLERNNDIIDVKKSLSHLEKALELVSDIEDEEVLKDKKHQLNVAIKEAKIQENKYKAQLNNYSPIFSLILNKETVLTFKNITDLVAAKKSVINSLGVVPNSLKNETTLYTLIILEDEFASIEESIHDVITDNSSFYPVAKHELAMFLSSEEMRQLNNNSIPDQLLKKISGNLGDDKLGIIRVTPTDRIDGTSYWLSTFRLWGNIPMEISSLYVTTGLSELINQRPYLILLVMLLGFPYVSFVNRFYKDQKGSSVPYWFAAVISLFSFLFAYVSFEGLSLLDINEQAFTTTIAGYKWVMAIVGIINLFPLIVSYILISRIPKISTLLNTASAISTLIFGVFVGTYNYLGFLAAYRLGFQESLEIIIPSFFILWILSIQLGKACSRYIDTYKPIAALESIFLSIWLYLFTIFVLKWDFDLLLQVSAAVILLAFSTGYIISLVSRLISTSSKKQTTDNEDVSSLTGLEWLSQSIDNPVFYKDPWKKEFDDAVNFIVNDTDEKIEVIYIEGGLGCGKTRAAKEIGHSIKDRYKGNNTEAMIFFGSCEETTGDEPSTPYHPFSQALGEFIGIGRFSDPAERAEKLQSGLLGTGLKVAMNATGTGALSTLLGSEKDNKGARKTNTREIATVISETLVNLAQQEKSKVVFILDDTQWMDEETFDLFKSLLEMLANNFSNNECCFILTSRPVESADKVKNLILELNEKEIIHLSMDINENILENESIVKNMLQNLRFEFRSQQALISYFSSLEVSRPLHVLQTLATLLKKKMIEPFGDRFIIPNLDSLQELPPSNDYRGMLQGLLGECDDRLISILHCCAIIGQEFKVSLVAEIFKIDPLEFLEILEEAIVAKILVDAPDCDDVYGFADKRIRGALKFLAYDENSTRFVTTQRVRIYHKRFISLKEKDLNFNDLTADGIDNELAVALAYHSNYIKDVFPEKAVKYNRIAAEQSYVKGMTSNAIKLYLNAVNATKIIGCKTNLKVILDLYISYSKCLLDAQKDPKEALKILDEANEALKEDGQSSLSEGDFSWIENEIMTLMALAYYRLRRFDESLSCSKNVLAKAIDPAQKCRAQFYHAASLPPKETELRKTEHMKVLNDIDHSIQKGEINDSIRLELLKVKSEALNNLGFILLFGLKKPPDALLYFKEAAELNEIPEINDQKGVGISHGGMGDCYKAQGELSSAEDAYKSNLKISTENGDIQGVCRMNSMLGEICLNKASLANESNDELFSRASNYYEDSLKAAVSQNNGVNIAFALAGIIEVCLASKNYTSFDYVLEELGRFIDSGLCKSIPDFARTRLKESMQTIKAISPELEEKANGYIKHLD